MIEPIRGHFLQGETEETRGILPADHDVAPKLMRYLHFLGRAATEPPGGCLMIRCQKTSRVGPSYCNSMKFKGLVVDVVACRLLNGHLIAVGRDTAQ